MNHFFHIPSVWPPFVEERRLALLAICRQHHLKRLWLFGSVLQPEKFGPQSDVDVLFEFWEERIADPDYLKNWDMFESKVQQLFNRNIDLVHYPSLQNPYFMEEMEEKAQLLYDSTSKEVPV
ncbi:MAG: nucleotidyltransferase domain-containing protein [Bacteroidota bacterium]